MRKHASSCVRMRVSAFSHSGAVVWLGVVVLLCLRVRSHAVFWCDVPHVVLLNRTIALVPMYFSLSVFQGSSRCVSQFLIASSPKDSWNDTDTDPPDTGEQETSPE